MEDKEVFWSDEKAQKNKEYDLTTWYRCFGIGDFLKRVGMKNIVGVILEPSGEESNNNIGFILKEDPKNIDSEETV